MSFSITTDVFCDDCGDWSEGVAANVIKKVEAWKMVERRGWIKVKRNHRRGERDNHYCPTCAKTYAEREKGTV